MPSVMFNHRTRKAAQRTAQALKREGVKFVTVKFDRKHKDYVVRGAVEVKR